MFKRFLKFDTATDGDQGKGGSDTATNPETPALNPESPQVSTTSPETQTATANISTLANSNIQSGEEWKGDPRYFQTGKKAGQLRPSAAVSGSDAEGAAKSQLTGLDVTALKNSRKKNTPAQPEVVDEKAQAKAEKKATEAKIGAKMAMRVLDLIVDFISKKQYGRDFTPDQKKERLDYRASLEKDWEDYLVTLDIPMHPALVVAFGSIMYTADAFNTPAGQERVQTLTEKIGGKLFGFMLGRKK